jgi:NAD(P)-dependent dehydrogenase (short-subunit alcohol dehydrogenase family)
MTETVVITGASAGIGRATAELFGLRGANVALLARGHDGLREAAEAVDNAGGVALEIPVDVADFEAVDAAAELAETQLGPIDIWVNVAFTSVFAPFWEIKPDEFRRVTEVSYLGFVHGTMAALARMRPRDRGTIVQVGSALGYRAIPLQSAYCGAKHAINGFTESIRTELMHDHSHVNITIVQMPAVNTPQFNWVLSRLPRRPQPVPPIYEPEVAAQGVVFAADHPERKEHWVGASTAGTIMAQKFAAPLLDQYLARTGYNSQQTDEREIPGRPNNLWQPVDQLPGSDQGAHGRFDDRAKSRSVQLTVAERVEEAGATVRRAFDTLLGAGRDNLFGGSLLGGARPRPPKQDDRRAWSDATSPQTDQGALPTAGDTPLVSQDVPPTTATAPTATAPTATAPTGKEADQAGQAAGPTGQAAPDADRGTALTDQDASPTSGGPQQSQERPHQTQERPHQTQDGPHQTQDGPHRSQGYSSADQVTPEHDEHTPEPSQENASAGQGTVQAAPPSAHSTPPSADPTPSASPPPAGRPPPIRDADVGNGRRHPPAAGHRPARPVRGRPPADRHGRHPADPHLGLRPDREHPVVAGRRTRHRAAAPGPAVTRPRPAAADQERHPPGRRHGGRPRDHADDRNRRRAWPLPRAVSLTSRPGRPASTLTGQDMTFRDQPGSYCG